MKRWEKVEPETPPRVYEVGGRIPWTANRHVFSNGECCLSLPDSRWWVWPPGSSFLDFFTGPVHNYFLGQSIVERGQEWPSGEWAHGADGVLEFYREILKIDDELAVARFIEAISRERYKGHWPCPCGSKKILRRCHKTLLFELRSKIPRMVAKQPFVSVAKKIVDARRNAAYSDPAAIGTQVASDRRRA